MFPGPERHGSGVRRRQAYHRRISARGKRAVVLLASGLGRTEEGLSSPLPISGRSGVVPVQVGRSSTGGALEAGRVEAEPEV